jgi:transcriptional regulator with XRE-family HTH domain
VTQERDWAAELTRVVAEGVRRYRKARNLTAQQLADRCTELGLSFNRSVIANLESGRRPLVTLAELLALARALEVPPVLLVTPLGHAETITVPPGRNVGVWDAFQWFVGEARLQEPTEALETVPIGYEPADPIRLFREHDDLLRRWHDAASRLKDWQALWPEVLRDPAGRRMIEADSLQRGGGRAGPLTDDELARYWAEQLREREDLARSALRSVREVMRHSGLTPPPLPEGLADLPGA